MSRFFSTKALKYRQLTARGPIDEDRPCPHCGYNLRGLPEGQRCPECGGDPAADASDESYVSSGVVERHPLVDMFATAMEDERRRWQTGLAIAAWCVIIAVGACLLHFAGSLLGGSRMTDGAYLILGLVVSIAWAVTAWFVLPARLGVIWPWSRGWRRFALATQWLWIAGYLAWMLAEFGTFTAGQTTMLMTGQIIARFIAGVGALVLVFLVRHVAEEAEIETAARRLNFALWLLPIVTPIAMLIGFVYPTTIPSAQRNPWGLVHVIFVLPPVVFTLAWAWLMALLALGLWQMQRYTYWVKRIALQMEGRDERIAEKRRQLQKVAEAQVRALPEKEHEDEAEDIVPEEGGP